MNLSSQKFYKILFFLVPVSAFFSCTTTHEPVKTEVDSIAKSKFSLRLQLEKKDADGLADSLILSTRGKNDVVLLDPVIQLNESHLNKVEFKKDGKETRKIVFYFNKEGSAVLSKLIKAKKKKLVVMMNNEVFETTDLTAEMKNGIFRLTKSIVISDADKLKDTIPVELLAK